MNHINFQLVTPEKKVLKRELVSLTCPTTLGEITILPHHIPLVAELKAGELHAKTEKEDFYLHIGGGFVQIKPGSEVVVLADAAEHHYEIDEKRALEAKERAEKVMAQTSKTSPDYAKVAVSLERSLTRLNVARKHANKNISNLNSGTFKE